ncbi:hypothetical protein SO802_031652, partial [Lithocarpus litseifolius]
PRFIVFLEVRRFYCAGRDSQRHFHVTSIIRDVGSFSGPALDSSCHLFDNGTTSSGSAFLCATANWGPHSETGGHCQVGLLSSTRSGRLMCQLLPE